WPHPQLGEISPARFIPLAEDVGLISRLGQIAMDTALADIKALNRRCQTDIGVSLNKSYREFFGAIEDDERWLQNLAKAQGNTQVIIEITESMLMEDDSVYSYLAQLRQSGIKIAIDDFGTGYSSLSYLRRFPVDWLKIDRSFVSDIVLNEEDLSLVESIIAMAHKLKLKVVAEGVETEQQWLLLKQLGCDMAQGFYFARPMPIDKLEAYMQGHAQPGGPQIEPAL
ncbi:MAG: EAL domain-containing protein, partial [Cellvibrionaceae bacterium]|nr:EAL domain-containing protein [Cellvibrionaceae bacterium]